MGKRDERGRFLKGNKEGFQIGNKLFLGLTPWNKGLTKEDPRVRKTGSQGKHWKLSEETKIKMRKPKSDEHKKKIREIRQNPENREILRKKWAGEKNPNWNSGSSFEKYPREFDEKLKDKIKKRSNNECVFCVMDYKEFEKRLGIIGWRREILLLEFKSNMSQNLHVHHIDYNKKNNREDNLIALCRRHHTATNFNRSYWEKYFKEGVIQWQMIQNQTKEQS